MANKHRGFVEIELDKPRRLRFTLNSLAELEDKLGVGIQEIGEVLSNPRMKDLLLLLWAGLIHEDEELTVERVGNMIDLSNMDMLSDKLGEAFSASNGSSQKKVTAAKKAGAGKK